MTTSASKPISKAEQYYRDGEYCVMLTNEERRYLALDDLRPEWESVSLFSVTHWRKKRTVLFYDGDTIVKVIFEECSIDDGKVWWKSYCEYDTRLATNGRKLLLPLTARGRAKPITSANVRAILPFGCQVDIYLEEHESEMWVRNPRNGQKIPLGKEKRIRDILSDHDFHEFMRYYISTCPEDYFERISELRSMEHQTVRFGAGDIFRCQTDREHYTYGIILGKTREIEKWDELPAEHSFRHLLAQPIIVRMYDFVTTDREMTAERLSRIPLRPPEIYCDEDILWGAHPIAAHKKLVPEDIQFPFHAAKRMAGLQNCSPHTSEQLAKVFGAYLPEDGGSLISLYVEWGFVSFDIPWDNVPDAVRKILDEGSYSNVGAALSISGAYCGRTLADILRETPRNRIRFDLLLPENREKFNLIMNCLGLPDDCSFDEFAERFGGISRQRYIELIGERCR